MAFLIRVSPTPVSTSAARPEINLCLVVDRSGSMAGVKMDLTRQAAAQVARALDQRDLLSIVLFDDRIDVLLPSTPLTDVPRALELIAGIQARGSTNLFDGWQSGAAQACLHAEANRLNRVVVLTDGQANVGETNTDAICTHIHRLCGKLVQTTTMGFGSDYNEDLLRAMAASGQGNHYFVQTPEQLPEFFQVELDGLSSTVGTNVKLVVRPVREGVTVRPLGESQVNAEGQYELGDLIAYSHLEMLFEAELPAFAEDGAGLEAELIYHSPQEGRSCRQVFPLLLPRLPVEQRALLPVDPEVQRQLAAAEAARARQQAMDALKGGDKAAATRILKDALELPGLGARERSDFEKLKQTVEQGDQSASAKMSSSMSSFYSRGSIVLSALDQVWFESLLTAPNPPLRKEAALWKTPPSRADRRSWPRVEGMLVALAAGEAKGRGPGAVRGQATCLVLATLPLLDKSVRPLPFLTGLVSALGRAAVPDPSPALQTFQKLHQEGRTIFETGAAFRVADNLTRVAPLLLTRWNNPEERMWSHVFLSSQITSQNAQVSLATMAYAHLLWELLVADSAPPPSFYYETFLATVRDLETDLEHESHCPRYDGWRGRFSKYLEKTVGEARRRGLKAREACLEWGSGADVWQAVPSLLYILEKHGREPRKALQEVCLDKDDPGCLGALVGAAMGALYGRPKSKHLDPDMDKAVSDLQSRMLS